MITGLWSLEKKPAGHNMTQQSIQDKSAAVSSKRSMTVLILDDDPSCRILLKSCLKKSLKDNREITVLEKGSLKETTESLEQTRCDILLIDLNLPDSQGLNTLDVLHNQFPDIPKVVITGETDHNIGLQAMSHGAQEYLVKGEYTSQSLGKSIFYAFERKRLQKSKDDAFAQLENANKQIRTAQSQIIQNEKMASIGQLAAGVAHEMNNPIGFVVCNFETLDKYIQKIKRLLHQYEQLADTAEGVAESRLLEQVLQIKNLRSELKIDFVMEDLKVLFDESQEGLSRVTTIIRNLRDFSRVDQIGEVAEYDLNQGLKSTLTVCQNELKYSCEIKTEFCEIPRIYCNPGQVNQVFLNILVNAAQAITSQNRPEKGHIVIQTSSDAEWICCQIHDDGPGIPQENLKKVFDPFFTTKPMGKGTGLGLSISYDIIVNKHKGFISVDSTIGQGTTFVIKLPIHSAPQESQDDFV
jgi:signal transduction histidine kinase